MIKFKDSKMERQKNNKIIASTLLLIVAISIASAINLGLETNTEVNSSNVKIQVSSQSNSQNIQQRTLLISGHAVQTDLELDSNSQIILSNGQMARISVTPQTAAQIAINSSNINNCSEENDCEITLKEKEKNNSVHASYEIEAKKQYKFLGMIRTQGNVQTYVDAQTGEVIETDTPWWAKISTEVKGDAAYQAQTN